MADFSTIKGFNIQTLASDPYASAEATGTWASGGSLNTPRGNNMGMTTGTQTAGLTFGGHQGSVKDETETYNGTAWTETGNAMNDARYNGGSQGTQTASVCFGGGLPTFTDKVELYNGSTWTESTAMPAARYGLAPAGSTSTSALAISGKNPPSTWTAETFELSGTSWTDVGNVNTSRMQGGAAGPVTAAIFCGGSADPNVVSDAVETWDGSTWTTGTALPAARYGVPSFGTSTACITSGGGNPAGDSQATTMFYDGTSWTELADLATARYSNATASGGTSESGLYVGDTASPYQATEEWSTASPVSVAQEGQVWYNSTSSVLKGFALNLAGGAWSSGNNLVDDRPAAGSWGTQTAAAYVCGSPREQKTELFNGTTWTEGNDTQTARNYNMAAGTPAAGLVFGGGVGGTPWATAASEEYDGTSWATGNPLTSIMAIAGGFGIQTAAMCSSGSPTGGADVTTNSQTYDGTSWSEGNNVNTARMYVKGAGTTTSGILASGTLIPSTTRTADTEQYDGTSWSQVNDVNTARGGYGMNKDGNNDGALIFAGTSGPSGNNLTNTELWDGTCWTEVADVATGTQELAGAGTTSAGLKMGGNTSTAPGGAVELWNSTGKSIKTFTAS